MPKVNEARDREIALVYQQGSTLRKVGLQFGISAMRVLQILRNLGIPRRPHEGHRTRTLEALRTGEKTCTKCGEVKPLDDFYLQDPTRSTAGGYMAECKRCKKQRTIDDHDKQKGERQTP